MSSSVQPRISLRRRIRRPSATKKAPASITLIHLVPHEQKHHEQNSWTHIWVNDTLRKREGRDRIADPKEQE